jgi:hypothetical protein
VGCAALAPAPARFSAWATFRPDRTMLSPITMTVTVAPDTMSTGGLEDDWLASSITLRPT